MVMLQRTRTEAFPNGIVILDQGTAYLRMGYAGESAPRLVYPNMAAKKIEAGSKPLYGRSAGEAHQYFSLYPHKRGLLIDAELQLQIWRSGFLSGDGQIPTHVDPNLCWKPSSKDSEKQCLTILVPENLPIETISDYVKMVFDKTSYGGLIIQEQASQVPYVYRCMRNSGAHIDSLLFPPLQRSDCSHPKSVAHRASEWTKVIHTGSPFLSYHVIESSNLPTPDTISYCYSNTGKDPNQSNTSVLFGSTDALTGLPYERNPWALPENCNRACVVVDLGHQSTRITPLFHRQLPAFQKKVLLPSCRRTAIGGILMAAILARGAAMRCAIDPGNNSLLHRSLVEESALCCNTSDGFVRTLEDTKKCMGLRGGKSFIPPTDPTWNRRIRKDPYHVAIGLPVYRKKGGRDPVGPCLFSLRPDKALPLASRYKNDERLALLANQPTSESPDVLDLGVIERFTCGEILFRPSLISPEYARETHGPLEPLSNQLFEYGLPSVVDAIEGSIMSAPVEIRHCLASQILLSGGLVSIPGVKERLLNELRPRLPSAYCIRILSPVELNDCGNLPWMGASCRIGAYPEAIDHMAITRAMYQELGADRCANLFVQNFETIAGIDQVFVRASS